MLNYTTRLHSSKQCGTGTEADTRSMEQDRKPRRKKKKKTTTHTHSYGWLIYNKWGKNIQWRKGGKYLQ